MLQLNIAEIEIVKKKRYRKAKKKRRKEEKTWTDLEVEGERKFSAAGWRGRRKERKYGCGDGEGVWLRDLVVMSC